MTESEEGSSFFANNYRNGSVIIYLSRARRAYILEDLPAALAIGSFDTFHSIANAHELAVDIFHSSSNGILDNLLNLPLDEASGERVDMFQVTDREL